MNDSFYKQKIEQLEMKLKESKRKADRTAKQLVIANKELALQHDEKSDRIVELINAYKELIYQNKERTEMIAKLNITNKSLTF